MAPAPVTAATQKVEVVVTKETRLLNDGSLRYREQFSSGSDIPNQYWAMEAAKRAGMLNIPEPFQLSNPQLLLDAHWLPYCVTMPSAMSVDHFLEVYGQSVQEYFSVSLALERVLDAKNKTVIKLFAPNYGCLLSLIHLNVRSWWIIKTVLTPSLIDSSKCGTTGFASTRKAKFDTYFCSCHYTEQTRGCASRTTIQ